MKILYQQNSEIRAETALSALHIRNGYLKEITFKNDYKKTTLKSHYHTEYEIHMIFCGRQSYEADGVIYDVHENEWILFPPKTKHRMVFASENLLKYSITFHSTDIPGDSCYYGMMTEEVINSIRFIAEEYRRKLPSAPLLIENRVLEVFVLLFRIIGYQETNQYADMLAGDARFEMVKKFNTLINKTIERAAKKSYNPIERCEFSFYKEENP